MKKWMDGMQKVTEDDDGQTYGSIGGSSATTPTQIQIENMTFRNTVAYGGASIDNATHSFFGVSKIYADTIVQEFGKNYGLKSACFRAGCITGPEHSGAKLHGFLSYLVKVCLTKKKYTLIGYKGKQVRDNLHSNDLVKCFWEFYKKPKSGEVYNIGGGRYSNCSIIEALNLVEKLTNSKIKRKIIKFPRVGDHIWYISNTSKFKKHYPNWKQLYNTKKIIEELIDYQK